MKTGHSGVVYYFYRTPGFPGIYIYTYIYIHKRENISLHPIITICSIQFSTLEFTPLGSLDLSAFRPRRVASRVALRVARRSSFQSPRTEGKKATLQRVPQRRDTEIRFLRGENGGVPGSFQVGNGVEMGMEKMCLISHDGSMVLVYIIC